MNGENASHKVKVSHEAVARMQRMVPAGSYFTRQPPVETGLRDGVELKSSGIRSYG